MNATARNVTGWLILALMLCQFLPLGRVRQPSALSGDDAAPAPRTLESRCGRCHGRTKWPKSAFVAPLSWYVVLKVQGAHRALDLTDGTNLGAAAKQRIRHYITSADFSAHPAIPGFEKPVLTGAERKLLLEWSAIR